MAIDAALADKTEWQAHASQVHNINMHKCLALFHCSGIAK